MYLLAQAKVSGSSVSVVVSSDLASTSHVMGAFEVEEWTEL